MRDGSFPFDLVGFDLDGTLLDTSDELTEAVNFTLAKIGRPPLTREEVKPMIGLGAKNMLRIGLEQAGEEDADGLVRQWLPTLLDFYGDNLGSGSQPYPGAIEAMDRLEAMGVKLAVVTNKYERFATKLLGEVGLAHRFGCIIGGDTMGKGFAKPHRAPIDEMKKRCGVETAAFIGDSIYDIEAGRSAGVPTIAVSFGFLTQPVDELGADAVIDHYDQLIGVLEGLG